jgi:hypothetical protein
MSVEDGRRSGRASTVDRRPIGDGVPTPAAATAASRSDTALRLARGYPPVLGAMLAIDGVVAMAAGATAAVSLGEAVTFLVLPPLAMLLVGRPVRVPVAAAGALAAAALLAALFLGGGVHLFSFPAWAEALAGTALLALAPMTLTPQDTSSRRA